MTAALSRGVMDNYSPKIYKKVGEFVSDHLIFSYFYIKNGNSTLYPNYTEDGFGFGETGGKYVLSKDKFESKFISSYVSTALDKTSSTAEEGSLHEIELISNKEKDNGENVELIGYLFIDSKGKADNGIPISVRNLKEKEINLNINNKELELFNTIQEIQVGGERIYGFGRLELEDVPKEDNKFFGKEINLYGSKPEIKSEDEKPEVALSHAIVKDGKEHFEKIKDVKGDLEPLVGREWSEKGAGQEVSNAGICLTPGTRFTLREGVKAEIGNFGIWHFRETS